MKLSKLERQRLVRQRMSDEYKLALADKHRDIADAHSEVKKCVLALEDLKKDLEEMYLTEAERR